MSFRLVPKLMTLNDLEWRNGPYFALFHRIFVYEVVIKQLLGLPRFQNLLFSERELTFTFAICYRPSVCRLSVCRLSVVCRL